MNNNIINADLNISAQNNVKRLAWVDAVKGICILLMIYGHTILPENMKVIIYTFHMPAFFILSGYTFNYKYNDFKEFAYKRLLPLLKAYLFFAVVSFFWSRFKYMIDQTIEPDTLHNFLGIFFSLRNSDFSSGNWFFTAMITGYIMFYLCTNKIYKNFLCLVFVTIVQFVLWTIYTVLFNKALPWALDTSLIVSVYLILGYLLKKYNIVYILSKNKKLSIIIIFLVWVYSFILNIIIRNEGFIRVDMNQNMYGCTILYLLHSIAGTIGLALIFFNINEQNILCSLGKKTLAIYGLHNIPNNVFLILINKINVFDGFLCKILIATLMVVLDLIIIFLIIKFNHKYLHIKILE